MSKVEASDLMCYSMVGMTTHVSLVNARSRVLSKRTVPYLGNLYLGSEVHLLRNCIPQLCHIAHNRSPILELIAFVGASTCTPSS